MHKNNRKAQQKQNFAANADKYNRQLDLILTFARDNKFPDYIMRGLEDQKVSIKTVGIGYGNTWIWNSLSKLFKERGYDILDLTSFFHRSNSNSKLGQKKAKFRAKPLVGRKSQWYRLVFNYKLHNEQLERRKIRFVLAQQRLAKIAQKFAQRESPEITEARLSYILAQRQVRKTNQAVFFPQEVLDEWANPQQPLINEVESIGISNEPTTEV